MYAKAGAPAALGDGGCEGTEAPVDSPPTAEIKTSPPALVRTPCPPGFHPLSFRKLPFLFWLLLVLSHMLPNVAHVFPLSSVFRPPFAPYRVPGFVTGGEFLSDPPRVSPPQSKCGADKNRLLCSFWSTPGHLISPQLVLGEVVRNSNYSYKNSSARAASGSDPLHGPHHGCHPREQRRLLGHVV